MKKIILLLLTTLATTASFSQTAGFNFKPDGTTEHVVFNADKMTASQLYSKTLAWVNETYKNPNSVIKAKNENEMIRIDGFLKDAFIRQLSSTTAGYDCTYTLVIEFQDGKYRTKFDVNELSVDGGKVYFSLANVIGNVKDQNGNGFVGSAESFNESVSILLNNLYVYITKTRESW